MSQASNDDDDDRILAEAAEWFAKARGPDAARWASELDAWRRDKPENDAAYARLLQRWDQSKFLAHSKLGRSRDLQSVSVWSRRPVARYGAVAAAALLVFGIGTVALERPRQPTPEAPRLAFASTERAVRMIALANGSRAILDAGSAIEIQAEAGARHVRLVRGRVRFEVVPEAAAFVVDADGGTIQSRSGVFDVALSDRVVRVVLWKGSLNVTRGLKPAVWSSQLIAGQQLAFDPTGGIPPYVQPADSGELGWTHGMLSFEQTPLPDAVIALNRYNRTQIKLSPQIGNLRITGAFHANDPEGFARAVSEMFGLTLVHGAGGTIDLSPGIKT